MNAITRRLIRLEDRFGSRKPRSVLRIVVSCADRPANLDNATCKRYFCTNGTLMEVIDLKGDDSQITSEKLDRFVERFPIT